jgi:hypothetical protein
LKNQINASRANSDNSLPEGAGRLSYQPQILVSNARFARRCFSEE